MARQRQATADQAASVLERSAETVGEVLGGATRTLADAGARALDSVRSVARRGGTVSGGTAAKRGAGTSKGSTHGGSTLAAKRSGGAGKNAGKGSATRSATSGGRSRSGSRSGGRRGGKKR